MHPGLLCQRYPCHPSHDCTAPFPEHFPGEFSGSYWQNSPMETVLSTDPRYKHSVPSNVLPTTPLVYEQTSTRLWQKHSRYSDRHSCSGGQLHHFPGASTDWDYFAELVLPKKLLEFYHSDRARVDIKWLKPEASLVCTSVFRTWDWDQILKTLYLLFNMQSQDVFSPICKGVSHPSQG